MGVSIDIWRVRIGSHNAGQDSGSIVLYGLPVTQILTSLHLYLVIFLLLIIGNVEINPGPLDVASCLQCNFQPNSAKQHMKHQEMHSNSFNFKFVCPFSACDHKYQTYRSLSMHVSRHSTGRNEIRVIQENERYKCSYCDQLVNCNSDYCKHLKANHLSSKGEQVEVQCPLFCDSQRCEFKTSRSTSFGLHLSRYHPGWLEDESTTALSEYAPITPEHDYEAADNVYGGDDDDGDDQFYDAEERMASGDEYDYDSDSTNNSDAFMRRTLDHDLIIKYIGNFYALLEGKLIVPSTTVDIIASRLGFISSVLQLKVKADLKRILTSEGISEDVISRVMGGVTSMDPFFNAHHVEAPGDCLLTSQRRLTYYKKHFKHQEATQINPNKNPHDTENSIQYVNIKDTLRIMLEDKSVEKAVEESFCAPPSDGTKLKDYKDGSVFQSSETPKKCIDLFLFMDACNCTNPIGSAKNKHKMHFMYIAIGNLKPHRRLLLKALRLVQIVNDNTFKISDKMFKKCFSKVMKDLSVLEAEGIDFKGERVAVRLQFFHGDNLGQHTIGGFIESFTGFNFCRFCDLCKKDYYEDCAKTKPKVLSGNWRSPASFDQALEETKTTGVYHVDGIKRDSPLNKLNHFHVCEPRLPPCISHDLFINGVVDCDMTSMIQEMIGKGWFTCHELNMKTDRFRYLENDGRNKPAKFKEDKSKLGGHAIQNWTLFRLFPIIIGDYKVDTNDKLWKLYLLLKSILEYCCAPALSIVQIETMRKLIKKYMRKRQSLANNYKPKHHFFSHYADLFLKFGPLIYMWTMAFEHRHQYFKRVALVCKNFINLGHTLASKFQLLQAYQSMGELFPEGPSFKESSPLEEIHEQDLADFLYHLQLPEETVEVKGLKLEEVAYKKNQWLLLGAVEDKIAVGKIRLLLYDGQKCRAIVEKYLAEKWECYGLYSIPDTAPCFSDVCLEELENPCPHAVYYLEDKLCFSLKHVFLA